MSEATEVKVFDGFSRRELQDIRDKANWYRSEGVKDSCNLMWVYAFAALQEAADRLDAMYARCEIPSGEVAHS